jgi:WD40 repeat protein
MIIEIRNFLGEAAHRIYYFVFGYDYFICFTGRDNDDPKGCYKKECGRTYASMLHRELIAKGLICFIDSEEFLAGQNWWQAGRLALRGSARMILVATPELTNSVPAMKEVRFFKERLGREVAPITFSDCELVGNERIISDIINDEVLRIPEAKESLIDGPSDGAIQKLLSTGKYGRQVFRRQRIMLASIATLSFLLVASVVSGYLAMLFLKQVREQLAVSYLRQGVEAAAANDTSLAALYFAKAKTLAPANSSISPVINRQLGQALKNSGVVLDEFYSDQSPGNQNAGNQLVNVSTIGDRNIGFFGGILDATTGVEIARLPHQDQVHGISLDKTGEVVVTASADRTVRLWDTNNFGQYSGTMYHHDGAHLGGFSTMANELYTHVYDFDKSTGRHRKWRIQRDETELHLSMLAPDEVVSEIVRSPCGMRAIIAGTQNSYLLDLSSNKVAQLGKMESNLSFARFSSCSRIAVIGNIDLNARIWDLETKTIVHEVPGVLDCCVLSCEKLVYINTSGLFLLSVHDGAVQQLFAQGDMSRLSLSPDETTLIAYSRPNANSKFIVYRLSDATFQAVQEDKSGRFGGNGIANVNWSPDSRRFVTSNLSGNVVVWDSKTLSKQATISEPKLVNAAYFHPTKDAVLVCCADKNARLRDASSGEMILPEFSHDAMVISASISHCGELAWTLDSTGTIKLWELECGTLIGKKKILSSRNQSSTSVFGRPSFINHHADKILLPGEGRVRVWDSAEMEIDQELLEPALEHLACRRLNENGGIELLTAAELDRMWERVKGRLLPPHERNDLN